VYSRPLYSMNSCTNRSCSVMEAFVHGACIVGIAFLGVTSKACASIITMAAQHRYPVYIALALAGVVLHTVSTGDLDPDET